MSTIGDLHFPSRPTTIPLGIWTIVVDAVDSEFRIRTTAHVGEEVGVVVPTWIDRYASAAVVFVGFAFRVFASLAQSVPRFVFWRHCMADSVSVFDGVVHSETAAGFGNPSFHVASKSDGYFPAVALTTESSKIAFDVEEREDKELSETLVGKVNTFRHVI